MALAMAREARLPANERGIRELGTVYASEQVHMSIAKAVALLGIGRDQLRLIPCDDDFRMRLDLLRTVDSKQTSGQGRLRLQSSAPRERVATGSIDPLSEIAAVLRRTPAHGFTSMAPTALWPPLPVLHSSPAWNWQTLFRSILTSGFISHSIVDACCSVIEAQARRTFSFTGDYAKSLLEDACGKLCVLRGIGGVVATIPRAEALAVAALSRDGEFSAADSE